MAKCKDDPFNEDEADRRYLLSKPSCFIIFGKPGSGKTTLAKNFAKYWRCIYISVATAIERGITYETKYGLEAHEALFKGESIHDDLLLNLLQEFMVSDEVQHHGYVLDGFPLLTTDEDNIINQFKFLKNLPMQPDFIINLKIRDADACNRLSGRKFDPVTNKLYDKQYYDIDDEKIVPKMPLMIDLDEMMEEEEEESEGGEDDEQKQYDKIEDDEAFDANTDIEESKDNVVVRLVVRNDEFKENIVTNISNFRKLVLPKIEDYIDAKDQQKVIELDATLPEKVVFQHLRLRLDSQLLHKVLTPIHLQGSEEQEEISEDTDLEDMLRSLAASEMIAPGFRWRRSRWGQLCPVSLYNGSNVVGKPEFSVSFMDKMFLLSSPEALQEFAENPRKFVKPPQPSPPCKLLILGAPLSGKTALCTKLAEKYHSKVINVDELVNEKFDALKEEKMNELKEKTLEPIISKVKFEGGEDIDENNPKVQELLSVEMEKHEKEFKLTADHYVTVLEEAFTDLYKGTEKGPSSGGWILDGFPHTKEEFSLMVERGIVPDEVIVYREETSENEVLINRWNKIIRNDEPLDSMSEEETMKKQEYEKLVQKFDRDWISLQSTMRNTNSIEPILIMCKMDEDEALTMATKKIEASFQHVGWEYTGMDQDEEEEDFAADEDLIEEDENEDPNRKKPFGETAHYCPVMLKEQQVLWPGIPDVAVKYREKVYFLASQEAQEKFLEAPEMYLPQKKPLKVPPIRLLLLGSKGSGKTLHGRLLAKKFGVLHISFKDRLQEILLPKTKKKIGPDFEFEEDQAEDDDDDEEDVGEKVENDDEGNDENEEEKPKNENEDEKQQPATKKVSEEEIIEDLTDLEENIRNNIIEDEALDGETLDQIMIPWWKEEPFKSQGFILEGFPRTPEEARYLASNGLFPDGAITLNVEDTNIVNRLMPPILERWRKQRERLLAKRDKKRQKQLKLREEERIRRKREKLQEREERKAEKLAQIQAGGGDPDELNADEDDYDLDEIIEMEILEELGEIEEDDMDDETEEEAIERIKEELSEKFEGEMSQLEGVQEVLEELLIPRLDIDASRKPHIIQYTIMKMLKSQVTFRNSLFDRCQVISAQLASKLLNHGYKKPSRFGRWDPVKLYDGSAFPPFVPKDRQCFPVIYRHFIYYLSDEETKERFIQSPQTFLQQPSPKSLVPVKMAIIGPPKSGKTTLAKRFEQEYGLIRLSMGEALRKIMVTHAHTKLVRQIEEYLLKGFPVPDELAIQALELCLMEPVCHTRGYILDGYPTTPKQMQLLHERCIIPYKVIYLSITDKEILNRGSVDRKASTRTYPLHDSQTILAIKVACFRREEKLITLFYKDNYKNLFRVDGEKSKWWVFTMVTEEINTTIRNIQTYIDRISEGHAACIRYMCITPENLTEHLGEFGEYCPVSLAENKQLHDCSNQTNHNLVAEYRGKYYRFPDEDKMNRFLHCPSRYVYPLAPNSLPKKEDLPRKRGVNYLKKIFPQEIELKGYCPVTYRDGKFKYEAIQPGENNYLVEYKKKVYSLVNEKCQDKFLRSPEKYWNLTLPNKLPPRKDPVIVSSLPILGFMEQTVSDSAIKALTAVGCLKPKFPFLSAKRSALLYVAYHLKAHNPRASDYVRKKYKRKLEEFEQNCDLIVYLSKNMNRKYLEPEDRPIDFDHKLNSFSAMQYVM